MPFYRNHNNLKLYYELYNGHDESFSENLPIILLHGFGSSAGFFRDQLKVLKSKFRILVFDAEGHGKSEKNPNEDLADHLMNSMVNDLLELLYILEIDGPFGLIGHSLVGGGIAQQLAILFPEKVKFLILLNSGTIVIDNPIRNAFWNLLPQHVRINFNRIVSENVEDLLDKTIPFIRGAILDEKHYSDFFYEKFDGIIESEIFEMIENPLDPSDIKCPTLIIGSELDNYAPFWMSKEIHDKVENSKLERIAMAGHFGPSQRSEEYNRIIWKFLHQQGL
ncbi:MAG: alpha/beta fold hydrolase [Candidatus Lokiarchaeota archaeon]|nr:alpha/beta fold hydrolase [Candidatus Lokiarchaeota archaeon]